MLKSMYCCIIIFFLHFIFESVYGQNFIGSTCTLQVSGSPGTCKLLTKCKKIRDELVQYNRLPQTCGFQETQPIVCCPNDPRKPGEISKQKCREYSSLEGGCGHKIVKRLTNGKKATRKEFPHMAQLGFENEAGRTFWACGGTIISEKYILTAAHCLKSKYGDPKFVRIGFTNVNDTDHRQVLKVLENIAHPSYKNPIVYNDVGLVKLEKPIQFNSYASPACLFTTFQIPENKAIATGWGLTERMTLSRDLLKVTMELGDYEYCRNKYNNVSISNNEVLGRGIVDEEQICNRKDTGEVKDTCEGDAGGPLQIYDGDLCMYKVIGVTSFGPKNCATDVPSVYTRVSHYIKWIEDVVWPQPSNL